MPYNGNFYQPDFQAPNIQLPQWQQMGDDQSNAAPDVGGFVQALKKKMTPTTTNGVQGGYTMPSATAPMSAGHEAGNTLPDMSKSKFGGGGGSSL